MKMIIGVKDIIMLMIATLLILGLFFRVIFEGEEIG